MEELRKRISPKAAQRQMMRELAHATGDTALAESIFDHGIERLRRDFKFPEGANMEDQLSRGHLSILAEHIEEILQVSMPADKRTELLKKFQNIIRITED
ncbi:MAG: hypothetical protein JW834_04235 [Candidatus Diapherotrites archaeon]|nr:hypothetical protein [Candidatus Diapherotrites archaeon]